MTNGYISKTNKNNYRVNFYNPISGNFQYVGCYDSLEEANREYSNYEMNFYIEKRYLLPKSIGIGKYGDKLKFKVSFNIKMANNSFKSVYLGYYNTLHEAIEAKKQFIASII